jgi:hypothetical protein
VHVTRCATVLVTMQHPPHTQAKKKTGYAIRWTVSPDARNGMVVKIGVTCTSANLRCHFAAELGCSRFPHAPHHTTAVGSTRRPPRNVEMGSGQIRKMCGRDELGMRSSDLTPPIIVISLVGRAGNYQPESPPSTHGPLRAPSHYKSSPLLLTHQTSSKN